MPNPYQAAGDSQSAYAKGFSDMIRHLAEQQAAQTSGLMANNNAPMTPGIASQVGDAGAADVLYGQTGYIPSTAYSQTGGAYQQYIDSLPGIYQQQLAYNAALNAPRFTSSGGGSSGGGSSGGSSSSDDGLTPYQMATLSLRADEIAYDRDQDDLDRELEIAKFDFDRLESKDDLALRKMMAKVSMALAGNTLKLGENTITNTAADNALAAKAEKRQAAALRLRIKEAKRVAANANRTYSLAVQKERRLASQFKNNKKNQGIANRLAKAKEARAAAEARRKAFLTALSALRYPNGRTVTPPRGSQGWNQ